MCFFAPRTGKKLLRCPSQIKLPAGVRHMLAERGQVQVDDTRFAKRSSVTFYGRVMRMCTPSHSSHRSGERSISWKAFRTWMVETLSKPGAVDDTGAVTKLLGADCSAALERMGPCMHSHAPPCLWLQPPSCRHTLQCSSRRHKSRSNKLTVCAAPTGKNAVLVRPALKPLFN